MPSSSLVCEGFVGQAGTTAAGLGFPNLPVAMVPGHVDTQTDDELRRNLLEGTLERIVANLTQAQPEAAPAVEPGPREVVFDGDFDEVNRFFYENGWSDGLPIVPPTAGRIERFLRFAGRDADDVLATLLPDGRKVTVWNVAVNGVMAGCRPEYMPILLALVEAMADPDYGVEHSGNTPGAETLIVLNGPIAAELGFNCEQGVLRDGFQPNTSVGRFWRLALRNLSGFRLHENDKGTFGNTFRVVLAENEAVLRRIGWPNVAADMGLAADDNAVTISRFTGGNVVASVYGTTPERMMPYLADAVAKQSGWELIFTVGLSTGMMRPLLVLSPILAETIAKAGWSKDDVKRYLYAHARVTAEQFERYITGYTNLVPGGRSLFDRAALGGTPAGFDESDDPRRLVPIVGEPDDFMVAVAGDLLRTNAYVFSHNGILGYPVTHRVRLPDDWPELLADARQG